MNLERLVCLEKDALVAFLKSPKTNINQDIMINEINYTILSEKDISNSFVKLSICCQSETFELYAISDVLYRISYTINNSHNKDMIRLSYSGSLLINNKKTSIIELFVNYNDKIKFIIESYSEFTEQISNKQDFFYYIDMLHLKKDVHIQVNNMLDWNIVGNNFLRLLKEI